MFPLFETIKVSDGRICHLEWHRRRLGQSCKIYFAREAAYKLTDVIVVPKNAKRDLFKLRFSYDADGYQLQFEPYANKKITSLKIIRDDTINYALKYSDRSHLEALLKQKGNCDDILIIKKGFVTDTSFSNIVFFDGKKWITPATPLLKGTCRERLLYEKKIFEADIKQKDLLHFTHFKLINAMRDFEETEKVHVNNMIW